jgi:hypothetical protein
MEIKMAELILQNGKIFQVEIITEIDIYESLGNGFKAKIWTIEGYECPFTDWTVEDLKEAKRLKIKTTIKTD